MLLRLLARQTRSPQTDEQFRQHLTDLHRRGALAPLWRVFVALLNYLRGNDDIEGASTVLGYVLAHDHPYKTDDALIDRAHAALSKHDGYAGWADAGAHLSRDQLVAFALGRLESDS